jgi:hypothetical protein
VQTRDESAVSLQEIHAAFITFGNARFVKLTVDDVSNQTRHPEEVSVMEKEELVRVKSDFADDTALNEAPL